MTAPLLHHADWSRQASIYEVNVRQFTPEGTLAAFEAHLPRLQALGVGILWFMPIQPIGVKNRKGTLGSYYSIRDYTAVNPEFGTAADFRRVVDKAHALGLKVIIDWVANHTAWDHAWVHQHPEWYQRNAQGEIHPYTYRPSPETEPEYWWDVIGLDYGRPTLWPAMMDAMAHWVREADIDGFRCDVASLVPTPFWEQARTALDRIKPMFMLAESDAPELHRRAFDMSYDWTLFDVLKKIARGQGRASDLHAWWERRQALYPADAYRMTFTANHDSNSWQGSDASLFGPAWQGMAVLAATLPGMPLLYGGQEAGLNRQLAFFDKDAIDWSTRAEQELCTRLMHLKRSHPALANGLAGGPLAWLATGDEAAVAFQRQAQGRGLQVAVNLGPEPRSVAGQALPGWGWHVEAA